jgi:hypothetical protein
MKEDAMKAIDDDGPFLCVAEVARLFKISRTAAYLAARLYIESGGAAGIPAVRVGRSVRFLAAGIERMAAGEVPTWHRR